MHRRPNRPFVAPLCLAAGLLLVALPGCRTNDPAKDDWFEGGPMRPASAETLQLTARVLAAKGETARAGYLLDRLAREFPDHLGTYTEGAELLLVEGRIGEAIRWLERGLARFPDHPILMNDRGVCHLLAADLAAATRDFEAAHAADPADAEYVGNLALVRALAGDEEAATRLWSRVVPPEDVRRNLETARLARANFAAPA